MLSFEEAFEYSSDILKISITGGKGSYSLKLLNQLIQASHEIIPFQSVTLMAKPLHERKKPTIDEVKSAVVSKQGGLCYTVNSFMKHLLDGLGFEVYHASSTIKHTNDHIVTIAVIEGLRYLVDVGNGYPTFEAILIDFEKESKIYCHSFLEYKFVKEEGSDKILRLHKKGDFRCINTHTCWRTACIIDTTPRDDTFFDKPMSHIYSCPDHLIFHTSLRIILFPQGQAIVLHDRKFYVEACHTRELVLKEEFSTDAETLEKIKQMFPNLYGPATKILGSLQ